MAKARPPTSAPGSSPGRRLRTRGFTLLEVMVVLAIMAIGAAAVSLAVRDPAAAQLDREATRLAALLEGARAESRSLGVPVRFVLASPGADTAFRFVGLPADLAGPQQWLDTQVQARIVGAPALVLGPEPLIGPQRIELQLAGRSLILATDGLAPFAPVEQAAGGGAPP